MPGPLWGTGGSAPPKGRRPKCGAGGGGGDILLEGKYSLAFSARGGLRHATGGRAYTNILDPYAGTDMDKRSILYFLLKHAKENLPGAFISARKRRGRPPNRTLDDARWTFVDDR